MAEPVRLRLSLYWFLYLGGMGIFFPFFQIHLDEVVGLSESRIGIVLAAIPIFGILGQLIWARVSDLTGSRRGVLSGLSFASALSFAWLGARTGFWGVLAGVAVMAFVTNAITPMLTALAMAALGEGGRRSFAWVRMWGTVGFLVFVQSTPRLIALHPAVKDAGEDFVAAADVSAWMFLGAGFLVFLSAFCAIGLPDTGEVSLKAARGDGRRLLAHQPIRRLLVFAFCAFTVMMGPIFHLPRILREHGGTIGTIADTWLGMLLVEIPLVASAGWLMKKLGPRGLLRVGILAEGVRWILTASVDRLEFVQAIQLMHGIGIAGIFVGMPFYMESCVPRHLRSSGQSLVHIAGVGLGAALSNLLFGVLLDAFGLRVPLMALGVSGILLAAATLWLLPMPARQE